MLNRPQKVSIKILLAIFILAGVFGATIFGAYPARAQYDANITASFNAWKIQQDIEKNKAEVAAALKKNKNFMVMNAVINAMSYFANKIAYDMAVWLASGGKGQAPFANTKGFFSYLAQVTGDSIGESLGSLSESLGLNLCDLPDPRLDLALQLGLHFKYEEPKPKCSWQQLKQAYSAESFKSKYLSKEGTLGRLGVSVAVKDTDFGIWTDARAKIDALAVQKEKSAQSDREEGSGIKAMTDLISGQVQTPAVAMKEEMVKQSASSKMTKEEARTTGEVWGAFGNGATQVAYKAASTFISTMLGTVLKNFMEKGMLPGGHKICNPGLTLTGIALEPCSSDSSAGTMADDYYSEAKNVDNKHAAQEMFSELLIPQIKTLDNYNLIAALAECSPENLSPDSCVVDQSFLQILQSADYGDPVTVKQAMEKGWLHGDWKLISWYDKAATQNRECSQSAYCYRNMQFLRKARILPLGFEIAAAMSPVDTPVSLKEAVEHFYNPLSPYYHLINPHWVIKLPKIRCKAFSFGAIAQNGARVEECVDLQHCVGFNKDGSCQTWGYCLKERPIWKINASYCDQQFSSCRAFTDIEGNSAAYLVRTLDTSYCNKENDGCRRYATGKVYYSATNTMWYPETTYYHSIAKVFTNASLYFNNQITTCDEVNDGCSAFKLASSPNTLLYLRKAPDYLGCYDADTKPGLLSRLADGITWPQDVADLDKIQPQSVEECKSYARVCLPEEENCNFYTSLLTQELIPGKFKPAEIIDTPGGSQLIWNDQCDSRCVGYDAYREMPSNYANGEYLTYIIPSSGKTCTPYEEGCASFTNLSGVSEAGMEQTEYFSYLRLCILPDQNKQKTFYIYESTEDGGYKLQSFVLERDAYGAPKQIFRDEEERLEYTDDSYCGLESYAEGEADPDCHQFNDDNGNVYYKLLSKTVLVSDNCTPYRLNNTELVDNQCPFDYDANGQRVGDAVEMRGKACYYYGLPSGDTRGAGETKICSAEFETCRAYKGNAGNNVRLVLDENFESNTTTGWQYAGFEISQESTQLNGHSLKFAAAEGFGRAELQMIQGKSYVLTFWAKGNTSITPRLSSEAGNVPMSINPISLTDIWHYYSYGPVEYTVTATGTALWFTVEDVDSSQVVFLDNIRLMEITDYVYLVKNSLSVDAICDSNPNDNLPGEALGCTAYQDPLKNYYYLTNFSYLCREAAVGCTALLDTYNTLDDEGPRAYNVWLDGGLVADDNKSASVTIGGDEFSCIIPIGENGCYVDIFGKKIEEIADFATESGLTSSTIYIPGDTPTSSPIYLVANKEATCKAENIGCQVLGKSALMINSLVDIFAVQYEDMAIRNDPALYDDTLCISEAVGCQGYKSGNSVYYFKDPKVIGQRVCVYRETPNINGWVWKDVGKCTGTLLQVCDIDSDCANVSPTSTCAFKNQIPCYPLHFKYNQNKNVFEFGLWSYGNAQYKGFAGQCPEEQSGCTEFIDHASAESQSKRCVFTGKKCEANSDCNEKEDDYCEINKSNAYYLLDNEQLNELKNKCGGMVSQAEGCVLFDQRDKPNKYWHTTSTYQKSQENNDVLVAPEDKGAENDANTILKVVHDRECAEWAYCDLKQVYEDEDTGEVTSRCYHLGACQKATGSSIFNKECIEPVTSWEGKGEVLDVDYYKNRDVYWDSLDYSGYSLYYRYQITDLTARPMKDDVYRLVYVDRSITSCFAYDAEENGEHQCGAPGDKAKCYHKECLYHPYGPTVDVDSAPKLHCRGYPEASSPFPKSVMEETGYAYKAFKEGFDGVNLCYSDNGNVISCDCSYKKLKTSADDIYKSANKGINGNYICSGGEKQGVYCNGSDDVETCGPDGICATIKTLNAMTGWEGYCLERDTRQFIEGTQRGSCLTWWPVEVPPGTSNIWDIDEKAGYQIAEGDKNRFMCLENEPVIWEPEKMIKIFTDTVDASDFNIQQFPKNSIYRLMEPGGGDYYLTNLPFNAAVAGCRESNNQYWYHMETSPSNPIYLANNDSAGMFCPINRDTLIKASGDMEICLDYGENGGYDEQTQSYSCAGWNPASGEGWTKAEYHKGKYFYRQEIERIDVFVDDMDGGTRSNGWVSFIGDFIDADEGEGDRYFTLSEHFIKNEGDSHYFVNKSLGASCATGWRAWEWHGGQGSPRWTIDNNDSVLENQNKMHILTEGVCLNQQRTRVVNSNYEEDQNIGIRIVWDENYALRGIWLNMENTIDPQHVWGFFFVIHFTNGHCSEFAKVSTSTTDYFRFKPFTNNLRTNREIPINQSPALINLPRTPELNASDYGLAYGNKGLWNAAGSEGPKYGWINPFIPFVSTNYNYLDTHSAFTFSQGGDYLKRYANTGFKAGVPLSVAMVGEDKYEGDSEDWFDYDDFSSGDDKPYEQMLEKMYAKVYSRHKAVFDDEDGYAGYEVVGGSVFDAADTEYAEILGMNIFPPHVAAPDNNSWKLDRISVNGQTEGTIYLLSGSQTHIKFYAWAHGNQMPLRKITVNKDDGLEITNDSASFGNRKFKCAEGTCGGAGGGAWQFPCEVGDDCAPVSGITGASQVCHYPALYDYRKFGNTAETGCHKGPYDFVADYNCPYGDMEIVYNGEQEDIIDWNYIKEKFWDAEYVCVARPKVQIVDNWGWSNGFCHSDLPVIGSGCYHDCEGEFCGSDYGWTPYDGYVVVVPMPE